jgi:hypothetical protein
MKKMMFSTLMVALLILAANCGTAREQIWAQPATSQEEVFQEIAATGSPPAGFADVLVKASLKTHLSGEGTLLESGNHPHGKEFYHFILNIDGQGVTWKVPGQRENIPVVRDRHTPDEGNGIKYALEKKIRLRAGAHRVVLDVPEENSTKTVTVNLQQGQSYTLEFLPIYLRYKWGHPAFPLGFQGFNLKLYESSIAKPGVSGKPL